MLNNIVSSLITSLMSPLFKLFSFCSSSSSCSILERMREQRLVLSVDKVVVGYMLSSSLDWVLSDPLLCVVSVVLLAELCLDDDPVELKK